MGALNYLLTGRPGPIPLDLATICRHRRLFCRLMAKIAAHITGNIWKIEVAVGDKVEEDDAVVILESMKMEIPVEAEDGGTVTEILCEEGQSVSEGDVLMILD